MRIIGVIDLLAGRAVHAKGGCRHGYRPVELAAGMRIDGDPCALARAYTALGIGELYLADLDAIAGGAEQETVVRAIAGTGVPLWLDAGVSTVAQAKRGIARGVTRVIVGLETLTSFAALREIAEAITPDRVAFSLDLRDGRPVTREESLRGVPIDVIAAHAVDAGARAVLLLDLARVGSGRGIDLSECDVVKRAIPGVTLLAGGGVRGVSDLTDLAAVGCDGVLVASALHRADGANLVQFATSISPEGSPHTGSYRST
jgi:phosphoribosylformimino-5-aminoimidazole carboxamide ribotide isomerase